MVERVEQWLAPQSHGSHGHHFSDEYSNKMAEGGRNEWREGGGKFAVEREEECFLSAFR